MAYEAIKRRDLYQRLNNVSQKDWKKAYRRLNLDFLEDYGKGSHGVIWDTQYPMENMRGLIATVQKRLFKEANQGIFKNLIIYGVAEDEIWKALKILQSSRNQVPLLFPSKTLV